MPLVEPLDPSAVTPAPEVQPAADADQQPEAEATPGLPSELLKIPAMQALIAGDPPAISANLKSYANHDEAKLLIKHKDALLEAGMGLYRSMSGEYGVIYNQLHIHPQDIQAADKMGKLLQIAPPIDVVDQAVAKSGDKNPVLARNSVPQGLASPQSAANPPQFASGASQSPPAPVTSPNSGLPAAAQRKLLQARITNTQPGTPTTGPAPGGGRLLNQVLKSVV